MKRLIARYAVERSDCYEIRTVFDNGTETVTADKARPHVPTLTHTHPAAIWFERKMADDFGLVFDDAFDTRPLVHQERFPPDVHPMRKTFGAQSRITPVEPVDYPYEAIDGDSVFQVAVGPIHAGIIEPGHFHFSQAGEAMLHQEVRHFYKYRGIEKMLEGMPPDDETAAAVIERISGSESIACQTAWRNLRLQMHGSTLPEGRRARDAFLLELERLIHHLTDLGFIPNDAGFGAALAAASILAEDARRLMQRLSGHRFGFGALRRDRPFEDKAALHTRLDALGRQIDAFEAWILDIPSLWDRFDGTGILRTRKAIKYDTVGVVARASGLPIDARKDDDFYRAYGFELQTQKTGDVAARFKLRLAEAKHSLAMMQRFLDDAEAEPRLAKNVRDGSYDTVCESSLGELYMSVDIEDGRIARFFMRDPSFMNWQALHLMMPGNIIADFPLINKSCDLSYAGNDL